MSNAKERRRAKRQAEQAAKGEGVSPKGGEGAAVSSAIGVQHPDPRKDAQIERLAMVGGWPVPQEYKGPLVERQIAIALDPLAEPRDSTSAYRAVLATAEHNRKLVDDENKTGETPSVNVQVNVGVQNVMMTAEEFAALPPEERIRLYRQKASGK